MSSVVFVLLFAWHLVRAFDSAWIKAVVMSATCVLLTTFGTAFLFIRDWQQQDREIKRRL